MPSSERNENCVLTQELELKLESLFIHNPPSIDIVELKYLMHFDEILMKFSKLSPSQITIPVDPSQFFHPINFLLFMFLTPVFIQYQYFITLHI